MNTDDLGNTLYQIAFVDHRKDASALSHADGMIEVRGENVPKRTTKGWYLCAAFNDGTAEGINLKDTKEGYPVQVAEYAVANTLVLEPVFRWWVPYTLKKRDRIIKAVKLRAVTKRKTEKYGLEVPGPQKRAFEMTERLTLNIGRKILEKK